MGCSRPTNPDGSYMRPSEPRDIGQLSNERGFRDRIYTMCYDAPDKGLVPNSLFRDPGRQWDLRHDRVPGRECDPNARANPATAVPPTWNGREWVGGSNHCKRKAADLMGRAQKWANDNCHRYGLFLAVSSEDWHYEATDYAPTVRILRYPGPTYDGQQPPKPAQPAEDDSMSAADVSELKTYIDKKMEAVTTWLTAIDNNNRDAAVAVKVVDEIEHGEPTVYAISAAGRLKLDAQSLEMIRNQLEFDGNGQPFLVNRDRIDGFPPIGGK